MKAANESDVTAAADEALDFDDETLKGERNCIAYFSRDVP